MVEEYLIVHALQTGQMIVLINRTQDIVKEFHKQIVDK